MLSPDGNLKPGVVIEKANGVPVSIHTPCQSRRYVESKKVFETNQLPGFDMTMVTSCFVSMGSYLTPYVTTCSRSLLLSLQTTAAEFVSSWTSVLQGNTVSETQQHRVKPPFR